METKAYFDGDLDHSRRGKKFKAIYPQRQNLYIKGENRELAKRLALKDISESKEFVNKFINRNPTRINWFNYIYIPIEQMLDKI
jgi:hypothetical protein